MAQAYDVLAGLNRMLESKERREQTKLQTSLAMMQFTQEKRIQDIQVAGQQLQMLQTANTQMMTTQSQEFLTSTGFAYYYNPENEDWAEEFKDVLTSTKDDGYGFGETDAFRIVGAVSSAYAGNPGPILDVAGELYDYASAGEELLSADAISFLGGFKKIGMFPSDDTVQLQRTFNQLKSIKQTIQNRDDIVSEMYEFGKGDFIIDRDISLAERSELPTAPSPPSGDPLSGLAFDIKSQSNQEYDDIQEMATKLRIQLGLKNDFEKEFSTLELMASEEKRTGRVILTDTQRTILSDKGAAERKIENQIKSLSEKLGKKKAVMTSLSALSIKDQLIKYEQEDWADDVDIGEMEKLLSRYHPGVADLIVQGKPLSVWWEAKKPGGLLTGEEGLGQDRLGTWEKTREMWELIGVAKKIQESKDLYELKTAWREGDKDWKIRSDLEDYPMSGE